MRDMTQKHIGVRKKKYSILTDYKYMRGEKKKKKSNRKTCLSTF